MIFLLEQSIVVLVTFAVALGLDSYYVSTFAGNGQSGISSDGVAALGSSIFDTYAGVWASTDGVVYISESGNYRIRKVGTDGILGTLAGSESGSQVTGAATSVVLDPAGIWGVDGDVYIASGYYNRILKVSGGYSSLFAGNGATAFLGNGVAASSAGVKEPWAICGDTNGNIYVGSSSSVYRVFKISNSIVTTLAGTGSKSKSSDGGKASSTSLGDIWALGSDSASNIYFSESYPRIRKVSTSGTISTFAGVGATGTSLNGLPATSTFIWENFGLWFDTAFNMFYPDRFPGK